MADYAVLARDLGVKIIGGCCGTSPEHVRAMAQALNQTPSASPATLAEIEAKLGQLWKDLSDGAEDGQSRRRRRRQWVEGDRGSSQTKACSLGVLMHTAAGFYPGGFSSDGDRDVAPLSITSL